MTDSGLVTRVDRRIAARRRCVLSVLAVLLLAVSARAQTIDLETVPGERAPGHRFVLRGLASDVLRALLEREPSRDLWKEAFSVHVGDASQPAMLASYRLIGATVELHPAFPLEPGLSYRAIYRPRQVDRMLGRPPSGDPSIARSFDLPPRPPQEPTRVVAVYPSAEVLPENLLKFYVHFSAPMSRGGVYRYVTLLDAEERAVELALLELEQELWDPRSQRLTLLFDPGRIKSGLVPRREVGPALLDGRSYTLRIDPAWRDARGQPLAKEHRKRFSVGPPDGDLPRPSRWRIEPPPVATRAPLQVLFDEPLDHALLQRLIGVETSAGETVTGTVEVADEETLWSFTPDRPWRAADYRLVVDAWLEDLAGNSVGAPFEVDRWEDPDELPRRPVQRVWRPRER